jgi:hypothetical protein
MVKLALDHVYLLRALVDEYRVNALIAGISRQGLLGRLVVIGQECPQKPKDECSIIFEGWMSLSDLCDFVF